MLNITFFNASLAKVMVAAGTDDLVQVIFTKAGDGRNVCQLTCCDGKGLQIMQSIGFGGGPVECGIAIVKASQLLGILRSYEALGFKEFSARILKGETENVLVLSNGKGEHRLPLADRMVNIDLKAAQDGAQYAAVCSTKALQAAVKAVSYAVGNSEYTAGLYFKAGEDGYSVMATDGYYGAVAGCGADFRAIKGAAEAERSFFAGKSVIKAVGALHGEAANMVVTPKYILVKDAEGMMAVCSLNSKQFPVQSLEQMMVPKTVSFGKPHLFDVGVKKDTLLALIDLAEATTVTKEAKTVAFRAVKAGDTADLMSGTQAVAGTVKAVESGDEISFSTALLKSVLNNLGEEDVFLRFHKGVALIYRKDSDGAAAFLMARGKK